MDATARKDTVHRSTPESSTRPKYGRALASLLGLYGVVTAYASFADTTSNRPIDQELGSLADGKSESVLSTKNAAAIKAIERDWLIASTTGNAAFIAQLLAADYTDLSYDSPTSPVAISGKEDGVKQASQRKTGATAPPTKMPTQRDVQVQIHGDIAIASGVAVLSAATPHAPARLLKFLDVFEFKNGRWYAISSEDIGP